MSETPETTSAPHHRSARERQRRGPMWGCLKALVYTFGGIALVLALVIGSGWWYLGTTSFADLVRLRIEKTLESRLGRKVSIAEVRVVRSHPQRILINDLRIANSPGGVHPYFATVRQVEITGGIDSFWGRRISLGRIDVRDPRLYFEVYPAGSKLEHNFPHWQSPPRGKYDIYHLDVGTLFIAGGALDFLDRRHDIAAVATGLASQVKVTLAKDVYEGTATSPLVNVRIQDYRPFQLDLRGGFRYTPNVLQLNSIALRGRDMQVFLSGRIDPLSDAKYNLRLASQLGLERVKEIFKVNKALAGQLTLDGRLKGTAGTFSLDGKWVSPKINADVYELSAVRGTLAVTDVHSTVDIESARYGGGTVAAHYLLPTYSEPYPMSVDLRYDGISLEKLFNDWGVADTGLRGAATGRLAYHWNKDLLLAGGGEGSARLSKSTTAFSNAKYPLPLGGSADFALDNGVVKFKAASLVTDASQIEFTGPVRIEDLYSELNLKIHSSDFSELDRAGYNFAHSAGKKTYTLLGLGGAGDITGTLRGRIKTPAVVAHISSSGTKYNDALLGDADIDLHYDGVKSVLTFDHAIFHQDGGRLALTGTVTFPDKGPSPLFDLAVEAAGYPVERALAIVNLPLKGIHGLGSGRLLISGSPDEGRVTFAGLTIAQKDARLTLKGDLDWAPGKGNVKFNLDVDAQSFPIADVAEFLDLGKLPVSGDLTGKLHLAGPKSQLEGSGALVVKNGVIAGEPVDVASADILFTKGRLRATNVNVTAPAGQITGQAELDLSTNQFSYTIQSSSIDLSKIKLLSSLSGLLGGKLTLTSSGGGTLDQPELVVQATLNEATVRGLALPAGSTAPSLYLAIRGGQLSIRGNISDVLTIDGSGSVGADLAVDGLVRVNAPDLARLLAIFPSTASLPATGAVAAEFRLGGKLSSLEALLIDGSFPRFDVKISEHQFSAARPLRVALRAGEIHFDDFEIRSPGANLVVSGYASLLDDKPVRIGIQGGLEAALLQLFVPGLRADGQVNLAANVGGSLTDPQITGTAEVLKAQFRFPGFPQMIDNVTGTVLFKGDHIEIDSMQASLGGGTVAAGGTITLAGLKPQGAHLSLQGKGVAIRYFEGITVDSDFNVVLDGDLDRMTLKGDVAVNRALYSRDFDFATAFLNVVLSRRSITPIVGASWQDRVSLDLNIATRTPGTLAVRNNIADVTGSTDIRVTGTLANPVVLGLVTIDEGGRVRLQNVDYRVVRGSINFQNPFRIDPYFDITLEGRVSGGGFTSELESGPIDVTINLTGTIDRFTPTITSDPPASDITLFSILGFGGVTNTNSSTNSDPTLIGQSLLLQGLNGILGNRILPFADTFSIDPGLLDTSSDPGTKVTIEKRISNAVRILVIYNLQHAHSRALVEWQINPDWTLQFTRDEVRKEYRAEARFRRRYEGHWAWGGNGRPVTLYASLGNLAAGGQAQVPIDVPADVPPPTGPQVVQVDFRADAAFDTSVLAQYVSVRTGRPLSIREVQNSIKSLFATGDFRDVRVETTPTATGADVTFVLSLNYRVAALQWDGLLGTDRERAERELSVHTGDVLSLNAVDRSAVAIQEFLQRSGYLEATVDPETQFERPRSRATVIFHVSEGPRAHVAAVTIDGDVTPFKPAELTALMKSGPGKPFLVANARSDADRMMRFMVRRGHRKADVRYVDNTYDQASKSVTVHYKASAGPVVKVEVVGVPERAVRKVIPFARNQAYSEDAVDTAAEDIVKLYQQRGYYNATADTEGRMVGDTWVTRFTVNPGDRFKLGAVTFSGNEKVPDSQLASVIQTAPSGAVRGFLAALFRRPTGVTRAQLSSDRDALESYYRLNGFSQAEVATPAVTTNSATGLMNVDFAIKEGPQTIVRGVKIEGNEQVPARDLPRPLLRPGAPLNPQTLRTDVVNLQAFYSDRGNAEVQVTPRPDISADKTSATITYVVAEGPRIRIDDVIVRGNTYTKSSVVLRKAELEKGDPFSYTSILEAQRNLYREGIFQRVDIQDEQAGTSASDRNVVIQVEEGKDVTLAGSVGATKQSDLPYSLLGSVSLAHRNLFGTGRYLGLELVGSNQRREAFLTYREPFLGPYNIPVQLTVFQSDEHRPSAHIVQRGSSIELSKVARLQTRWSLRYEYRIGDCKVATDDDLCAQAKQAIIPGVDRAITDIRISSITPTFFWDRRDDPIDPHRGFFTTAAVEYAFPLFRADAHFLKEYTQASYYFPVSERSVFAVSSRLGFIQSIGSVDIDGVSQRRPVPYTERFIGGGANSHRAFPLDMLGTLCAPGDEGCSGTLVRLIDPKTGAGTIAPIGGNGVFITNLEYRFPIFSSLGGSVFTDAGNVFADPSIRFNELRWGIGTGIRYVSPLGPIRFDIGYPLRRRDYEKSFAYFITLGYAF